MMIIINSRRFGIKVVISLHFQPYIDRMWYMRILQLYGVQTNPNTLEYADAVYKGFVFAQIQIFAETGDITAEIFKHTIF